MQHTKTSLKWFKIILKNFIYNISNFFHHCLFWNWIKRKRSNLQVYRSKEKRTKMLHFLISCFTSKCKSVILNSIYCKSIHSYLSAYSAPIYESKCKRGGFLKEMNNNLQGTVLKSKQRREMPYLFAGGGGTEWKINT